MHDEFAQLAATAYTRGHSFTPHTF